MAGKGKEIVSISPGDGGQATKAKPSEPGVDWINDNDKELKMGCFSFLCKKCGRSILSNSFGGQECKLFLLADGKVIEKLEGEYDSYGGVFIDDTQDETVKHDLRLSRKFTFNNVFKLHASSITEANGIAAYHSKCYSGDVPKSRSEVDPNQGM